MTARPAILVLTHLAMLAAGFAAGIYVLPILTAQPGASAGQVQAISQQARYAGTFRKDLAGSDALHWASGRLHVSASALAFEGSVAPGPDYRIYLAPAFVDNKEAFLRIKDQSLQVGELKTFGNFHRGFAGRGGSLPVRGGGDLVRAVRAVYRRGGVSVGTACRSRRGAMAPIGCTRPKEKRADPDNRPNEPRKTSRRRRYESQATARAGMGACRAGIRRQYSEAVTQADGGAGLVLAGNHGAHAV
ncbi:exported hypothetical protein [Cupriavidus taiwanensis]|nr:exported hypothetical protein [Cupriavidus taiwanensis]SOY69761.1 exported hypothetical protein [Cupriavidus taiwanensis]SOY95247.1 exported hypothetical protein [Cupriavidus taiwanensis]SOZ71880.1 exported hypothetical protein [Cupriavidus taiwanensis]SOZ87182.1 exported hypothetical protein [Cupriavidus taiwanensis]